MISVNIVTSDRGWILERLATEIATRLDYVQHTEAPDPAADINYYITYSCWTGRVSPIEVGWFAHMEPAGEAYDKFFATATAMDHCLTQARMYEEILRGRGITNVSTFSPGVDLDRFVPKLNIGIVGRAYHTGRKGENLVAQLMDMPEIRWHFTGAGWPGPALELSDEALPQFYRDMDYILVPSLYEGGPMCVVEALASGTEVISSPVGWVSDFPHVSFKTGDVQDLRRVLLDLFAKKQKLRQNVISRTWDAWAHSHDELFQTLATKSSAGRMTSASGSKPRPVRANIGRVGLLMHGNEASSQGGPSVRVPRTARELNKTGVRSEALLFNDTDLSRFDIVHTFNVWSPQSALKSLRQARRQKKVSVFSPIFLDLSERPLWDKEFPNVFEQTERPIEIEAKLEEIASRWENVRHNPALAEEPMGGYFAMVREMISLADHLILLSEKERQLLTAIAADPKSSSIVHNPTDNAAFKAADPALFLDTYGFQDFVLCVGRIEERKNQLMLAHALRETGIPLVLIGHAPSKRYRELIERHGGENVHFIGRLQAGSDLLLSAFRAARVAALPSWSEGAPLAALEASAAGAALVLSNRSSEPEYFGSFARYANPADPASIRTAILEAYETPRGEAARQAQIAYVEANFSWATYTQRTRQAYETAMSLKAEKPLLPRLPPSLSGISKASNTALLNILFDVTTTVNRTGRITGIARVELSLALEMAARPNIAVRFVYWENRRRRFIEIPDAALRGNDLELYRESEKDSDFPDPEVAPGALFIMAGSGWMQNATYAEGVVAFAHQKQAQLTVVIHDLIPIMFPYWFNDEYVPVFERNMRVILSNADRIVAISQTTKRDVESVLRQQIEIDFDVVTFREGDQIGAYENIEVAESVPPSLERFAGTDFVIAVGAIHARKNHKVLYDVWVRLSEQLSGRCPTLLIIGGTAWNGVDLARSIKSDKRLRGKVQLLSDVDDVGLSWLYRNCIFTVYPSLYEGWGLPVCESLRYGKICLASNASSIQEIAPEVTDLLDPLDFTAWYTRIRFYATSVGARRDREAAIRAEYRPTSWADAASELSSKLRTPLRPNFEKARYYLGARINLASGNNIRRFVRGSWHISESWGSWTAGFSAGLEFFLPTRPTEDLVLAVNAKALPPKDGRLDVDVMVNGQRAVTWVFHNHVPQFRFVTINWNAVGPDGRLQFEFTNSNLFRISEVTNSAQDQRVVGFGITTAVLIEATRTHGLRAMLDPKAECDETMAAGERFSLLDGRRASRMQSGNWQKSSAWGLFSESEDSRLYVPFDAVPPLPAKLRFMLRGAAEVGEPLLITVLANGTEVAKWQITHSGIAEYDAIIPPSVQAVCQPVEISFVPETRCSPQQRGVGCEKRLLSFGLFEISETSATSFRHPPAPTIPVVELGETISFRAGSLSRAGALPATFLQRGWYQAEKGGTWSRGTTGEFAFRLDRVLVNNLTIYLTVRIFGVSQINPAGLLVDVNGREIAGKTLTLDTPLTLEIDLEPGDIGEDRVIWLTLQSARALAPSAVGKSKDDRLLGVQIITLETESGLVLQPLRQYLTGSQTEISDAFLQGWHHPESAGRWSKAGQGRLRSVVNAGDVEEATLQVTARIYGPLMEEAVKVQVLSGETLLTTWTFLDDDNQNRDLQVPLQRRGGKSVLDLTFVRHDAISPAVLGFSDDTRELGLWLGSLEILTEQARQLLVGHRIDLLDSASLSMLNGHWERTAGWGACPLNGSSTLTFVLDRNFSAEEVAVEFIIRPVATMDQPQMVAVLVNGTQADEWRFTNDDLHRCRLLPAGSHPGQPLEITFIPIRAVCSPFDLSIGAETRTFVFGLYEIALVFTRALPEGVAADLPVLRLGEKLCFKTGAFSRTGTQVKSYLNAGWFTVERSGVWMRGREASITFTFGHPVSVPLALTINLRAVASRTSPVEVTFIINNVAILTEILVGGDYKDVSTDIPVDVLNRNGAMTIELRTSKATAPSSNGKSNDDRLLGIHLASIRLSSIAVLHPGTLYGSSGEHCIFAFLNEGWYTPEDNGVWSGKDASRICARIPQDSEDFVTLTVTARVFGTEHTGPATVELCAGDTVLYPWIFHTDGHVTQIVKIPVTDVDKSRVIDLVLRRVGAISPSAVGGNDHRVLGTWIGSITLNETSSPSLAADLN